MNKNQPAPTFGESSSEAHPDRLFSGAPVTEPVPELPPVLSMAGIHRLFGKSRRAVEMMVVTDKIGSYKDGHLTLCYVIDAVKLWGDPRKKGE